VERPDSPDDRVDEAVRRLRRVLTDHPAAARAIFHALLSEGRAYAQTAEGQELLGRLTQSEMVTRLRSVWEIVSFETADDAAPRQSSLPSAAIEHFVRAALQPSSESRVHDALRRRRSP
jgi:hypothetical protein